MAYTRVWDEAAPLGSVAANTIETIFQQFKTDIRERITDVLDIADFTADPVVPRTLKLNRTTTAKILGGSTSISIRNAADSADNLLIADAGIVTARNNLHVGTAAFSIQSGFSKLGINTNAQILANAGVGSLSMYMHNAEYVGANTYNRISVDLATRYYQNAGQHVFDTAVTGAAGSAITWVQALSIAAGAVITTPVLTAAGGIKVTGGTFAGIGAGGGRIYADTTDGLSIVGRAGTASDITFYDNAGAGVRMRITSGGIVKIGTPAHDVGAADGSILLGYTKHLRGSGYSLYAAATIHMLSTNAVGGANYLAFGDSSVKTQISFLDDVSGTAKSGFLYRDASGFLKMS